MTAPPDAAPESAPKYNPGPDLSTNRGTATPSARREFLRDFAPRSSVRDMLFSEVTSEESYIVTGYETGRVGINQVAHTHSLIVRPHQLQTDWPVQTVGELQVEHLQALLDHPPEVLLIGTGETQQFPDRAVWRHLRAQGLGVEIMDTAAACRTYNLIMAEGRDVAAALIIEG